MVQRVLEVDKLKVGIRDDGRKISIVNGISFHLHKGETLGIVGESGCGKSMTSLSLMGLLPPGVERHDGDVRLGDLRFKDFTKKDWRKIRGKKISMIFQEPMSSLNPVYTIGEQIMEMILSHEKVSKKAARARALEMLKLVGIPRPEQVLDEYPYQLSGGMRQRVMIAIALSCNPEVLIADEPTTALDVTIQAQILELMKDIQNKLHMSIVLITHDLGVVAEMCDRVIVMYAGEVVEESSVVELFDHPKHPYTKGLIASLPDVEEQREYLSSIPGVVPAPGNMPSGCRFAPRCSLAHDRCIETPPQFTTESGSQVKCWLFEEKESEVAAT
ncbi:peptide ABC transporter ATP-binding protein [Cytobacillus firmus]|uniref:ABC transporter ATP-binding protein n=1 Tax=Cytobacillus firmus TaxID=1399 RepID=UPI00077CC5F8|nr:ABC transporter ATP-binding protein [Cytobacillus firmus]MBG9545475.1 peptide ABC transporter ATP-binding protein [Cytobacillus firmus]MBG9551209.1 peptide ABC transporter ATP-binding protein [Cytobacillus firmus]MBG9557991.1 peptide ABC transporter ATP-binding protein [Cytobacillus firmus]MBG9577614.1 peptide ABC transporter ATP-binding protein [Cytobacillus firmus]MEC1891617.1 ABC transporter ATP-binding protein [Cytobacillus firmus]